MGSFPETEIDPIGQRREVMQIGDSRDLAFQQSPLQWKRH